MVPMLHQILNNVRVDLGNYKENFHHERANKTRVCEVTVLASTLVQDVFQRD